VIPSIGRLPRLALLRVLLPGGALLAAAAATAAALEEPAPKTRLDEMDMGMLQRSLLKIYVCGKESTIHERKLDELRLATQADKDLLRPAGTVAVPTALAAVREERAKHIWNYMLAEKTNAVQMVRIIDRVLGVEEHLAGEGRAERAILERAVELIEIPKGANGKGTEFREAGKILAEVLGCPVRVETIDTEFYRISLTMGPTTGEAIIKQVCAQLPKFDYSIDNGTLVFRHRDLGKAVPKGEGPGKDDGLDDEEKKAQDEEREKKGGGK
jgi:hypothetical protein